MHPPSWNTSGRWNPLCEPPFFLCFIVSASKCCFALLGLHTEIKRGCLTKSLFAWGPSRWINLCRNLRNGTRNWLDPLFRPQTKNHFPSALKYRTLHATIAREFFRSFFCSLDFYDYFCLRTWWCCTLPWCYSLFHVIFPQCSCFDMTATRRLHATLYRDNTLHVEPVAARVTTLLSNLGNYLSNKKVMLQITLCTDQFIHRDISEQNFSISRWELRQTCVY